MSSTNLMPLYVLPPATNEDLELTLQPMEEPLPYLGRAIAAANDADDEDDIRDSRFNIPMLLAAVVMFALIVGTGVSLAMVIAGYAPVVWHLLTGTPAVGLSIAALLAWVLAAMVLRRRLAASVSELEGLARSFK